MTLFFMRQCSVTKRIQDVLRSQLLQAINIIAEHIKVNLCTNHKLTGVDLEVRIGVPVPVFLALFLGDWLSGPILTQFQLFRIHHQ